MRLPRSVGPISRQAASGTWTRWRRTFTTPRTWLFSSTGAPSSLLKHPERSLPSASVANSPYLAEGDSDHVASARVDPTALGLRLEEVEGTGLAAWHMGRVSVSLSPP